MEGTNGVKDRAEEGSLLPQHGGWWKNGRGRRRRVERSVARIEVRDV